MKTKEKTLQIRRARIEKSLKNRKRQIYFSYIPLFNRKIFLENQTTSFS
ncbi:MAG: hypothetical protein AABW75_04490 [Nanoarchaeota archaeon]